MDQRQREKTLSIDGRWWQRKGEEAVIVIAMTIVVIKERLDW
jgi:hypothetical protein